MRPWRIAGWLAACGWIAWCAYYVASPRPPFEFFADLGGYAETAGRMGTLATSPQAVLEMFDWQTWVEQPAFVLFPLGTLYSALPLELALRDPFGTVKLVQVAQLSIAFGATAWLFGLLFGRTPWRWFAAFAYAAMPLCTLAVRGEPDFGWVLALIPVALAVNLVLGRRAGPWAFPLAGLLCAVAGGAFYAEHYAIVGVALLLLTAAFYRIEGIALRPIYVLAPALAFALFPAYYVLPTLYGPHPLWFSESYQTGLRSEDVLALFSARAGDQIAGVLRENLVSPDRALDASRSLPFALVAGAMLWAMLIAAMVSSRASIGRWWPVAAVGGVWTFLAMGVNVPFLGPWVWAQVAAHPLLAGMRTPDRFGQLTAILVALGGTYGAMRLYARAGWRRAVATAACVLVVAGYGAFDVRERAMGLGDMESRLPSQPATDARARALGGRTVTLAFSQGGSLFDPAPYSLVTPTVVSAWDVAARFPGDAGVPLLRRAGVRSIVTSPVWTANTQTGMPADMAVPVAASGMASPLVGNAGSVRLFGVTRPRDAVVRADLVCAFGGPAGFEAAAGLPSLDGAALVHGAEHPCGRRIYAGGDPLDDVLPTSPFNWSGRAAFEGLGLALPSPYAYEIERFTLTQPWYRYAYYGDSLLDPPFAIDDPLKHSLPLTFSPTSAANYALFARVSGVATLLTRDGSGKLVAVRSRRNRGFRWIALPLGRLSPGTYTRTIDVTRDSSTLQPLVVDTIAAAPVSVAGAGPRSDAALVLPDAFAPPLHATALDLLHVFPKVQTDVTARAQGASVDARTVVGTFDGEAGIRSSEPQSRVSFIWDAPDGLYAVGASAWLAGGDSSLAIVAPGGTISQGYDPGVGPVPTAARGYLRLRRGDRLDAIMTTPSLPANATNTLLEVTAIAAGSDPEPTDYDANGESWSFDAKNVLRFLAAGSSNAVLRPQSMPPIANAPGVAPPTILVAPEGTSSTIAFRPSVYGGTVEARVGATGLLGTVTLRCGDASQSVDMGTASRHAIVATLSVATPRIVACSIAFRWRSFDFGVRGVSIHATGTRVQGWETPQYFSAGSYAWSVTRGSPPLLAVDGTPWLAGQRRTLSGGTHSLRLLRASFPLAPLFFTRIAVPGERPRPVPVLEATHLNDGYWFAGTGANAVRGYACDLIETCFDTDAEGPVVHAVPPALGKGLAITGLDAIACFGLVAVGLLRTKRRAPT